MEIIRTFAKQLRRELTMEEKRRWYLLRGRRFAHYKFRRQQPIGNYILNFACCEARLAIELDGGLHDENQEYDRQITVWLDQKGWHVIRFWNNELWQNEEAAPEKVFEALQTLGPSTRPSP